MKKQSGNSNSISKYFKEKKEDINNTNEILKLKSEKENGDFKLDVPILERNKMRKFINVDKKGSFNRLNTINSDYVSRGYKNNFDDGFNIENNGRREISGYLNSNTFNTSTPNEKTDNDKKFIDLKDFEDKINRYNDIDSSLRFMNSGKLI